MTQIDEFIGPYSFLSNFYQCPVNYEGLLYPSSEHAYQAAKTLNVRVRKIFANKELTAGEAKALGKEIKLRVNWDSIKIEVMTDILRSKFQAFYLKKSLLETGEVELIEGNEWHDTFWGICKGSGHNHLGKILMKVRAEISEA